MEWIGCVSGSWGWVFDLKVFLIFERLILRFFVESEGFELIFFLLPQASIRGLVIKNKR